MSPSNIYRGVEILNLDFSLNLFTKLDTVYGWNYLNVTYYHKLDFNKFTIFLFSICMKSQVFSKGQSPNDSFSIAVLSLLKMESGKIPWEASAGYPWRWLELALTSAFLMTSDGEHCFCAYLPFLHLFLFWWRIY